MFAGSEGGRQPTIGSVVYWCYVSAVLIQALEALAFIYRPTILYDTATDPVAQLFVRGVGVALLSLSIIFWSFRHIPIQTGVGDMQVASAAHCVARLFAQFHTLMSMLLTCSLRSGMSIPRGRIALGLHAVWAVAMASALLRNHQAIHGRLIDTSSSSAAVRSVVQIIKGDDGATQPRSMMQMIKVGDSTSSKSVMQMLQDEIKTD